MSTYDSTNTQPGTVSTAKPSHVDYVLTHLLGSPSIHLTIHIFLIPLDDSPPFDSPSVLSMRQLSLHSLAEHLILSKKQHPTRNPTATTSVIISEVDFVFAVLKLQARNGGKEGPRTMMVLPPLYRTR